MQNRCCRFLKESMILLWFTIVSIDFVTVFVVAESTTVVNTTSGPVRGEILATFNSVKYASFLGIRYAKPPVGYLRFKPPVAADPWTEIFDATDDSEPCIQYDEIRIVIEGSEDCLFLNVYTPVVDLAETPKNLKPVLFVVYGGAYLTGTASSKIERPDYFLHKDIVYVTLNYRSGLFGYLALGIANATGNAGLKDVVLGLKWVKANIAKFGGNPNNVTIGGFSSGAAIVDYLVLSDASAGLFHGAIHMSGTVSAPWSHQTPAKALAQAERLADLMGLTWTDRETLLRAFYDAPAEEIVNATAQISTLVPFAPTIENESIATDVFLSRSAMDKFTSGNFSKVPHILGYTDQETVSFVRGSVWLRDTVNICFNAAEQLNLSLPPSITSAYNALKYWTIFDEVMDYTELQKFITDTSNLLYIAPVNHTQKILAANNNNNPVYLYHLSYFLPGWPHYIAANNTLPGSGHGDDLRLIYYIATDNYTDDPIANLTVQRVSTMWSNFVKYGNPTPDWLDDNSLNFTWPDSGTSGLLLNIGSELTLEPITVSNDAKSLEKPSWPYLSSFYFYLGCTLLLNAIYKCLIEGRLGRCGITSTYFYLFVLILPIFLFPDTTTVSGTKPSPCRYSGLEAITLTTRPTHLITWPHHREAKGCQ